MSTLPRVLIYGGPGDQAESLAKALHGRYQPIRAESMGQALQLLRGGEFTGICLLNGQHATLTDAALFPQIGGILSHLPDGLAIVDNCLKIQWTNSRFAELSGSNVSLVGCGIIEAFGASEILGPDLSPFHTALGSGSPARTTLRLSDQSFFEVYATPVTTPENSIPEYLVVSVHDVSAEVLQQQKLNAIFKAGLELGDIAPKLL